MISLSLTAIKALEEFIANKFDKITLRFLGLIPKINKEKKLILSSGKNSLTSLFLEALGSKTPTKSEEDTLKALLKIANGYMEAVKAKTTAKIVDEVNAQFSNASIDEDVSIIKVKEIITENMSKVKSHVEMIVGAESNKAINTATALQITKVAASQGVDDATVYFLVTQDDTTGSEEYVLHLLPDRKTPRVWRLSEVQADFHKKGGLYPSLSGLHPNCFTKDCRILTSQGLPKIIDLLNGTHNEVAIDGRIQNKVECGNQFGEAVPGSIRLNRQSHNPERLLLATPVYKTGIQPIYRIKLKSGHELKVSNKHEFIVDDGNKGYRITADQLKIGDLIPLFSKGECFGKLHFPDLAELMGNLLGDGVYNPNGQSVWNFFGNDIEYGADLLNKTLAFSNRYGQTNKLTSLSVKPPNNKYNVEYTRFSSSILSSIFKNEFSLSKKPRRVPEKIFYSDKPTVSAFLRGLYSADGHSEKNGGIVLAQNDYEFLQQIQLLLSMYGIVAHIYDHGEQQDKVITYANGDKFITHRKECWRLVIGGRLQYKKFLDDIGFGVPDKQKIAVERLENIKLNPHKGSHRASRISEIEILPEEETFCLTEPMTNTVTANGMVTCQCRCRLLFLSHGWSFDEKGYIKYKDKNWDEFKYQREKYGLPR